MAGEVNPGTLAFFPLLPLCSPAPRGSPGRGSGPEKGTDLLPLGTERLLDLSEPLVPPLQNRHQNASPYGFLEGLSEARSCARVQGGLKVSGAVSLGNVPPCLQGSPGGLQTDVPRRVPGGTPGAGPRTQAALLGFQKQLHAAPQKEGALGHPEWKSASRRQHVAEVGASRPALPLAWARVSPHRASVSWTAKGAHSFGTGGHCQGKQPREALG